MHIFLLRLRQTAAVGLHDPLILQLALGLQLGRSSVAGCGGLSGEAAGLEALSCDSSALGAMTAVVAAKAARRANSRRESRLFNFNSSRRSSMDSSESMDSSDMEDSSRIATLAETRKPNGRETASQSRCSPRSPFRDRTPQNEKARMFSVPRCLCGDSDFQITTVSLYSPYTCRMASEISPTVACASTASTITGIRLPVPRAVSSTAFTAACHLA